MVFFFLYCPEMRSVYCACSSPHNRTAQRGTHSIFTSGRRLLFLKSYWSTDVPISLDDHSSNRRYKDVPRSSRLFISCPVRWSSVTLPSMLTVIPVTVTRTDPPRVVAP